MKTYIETKVTKQVLKGIDEGKFYDIKFSSDAIGFTSEMGRTIKGLFKKQISELTPYYILLPSSERKAVEQIEPKKPLSEITDEHAIEVAKIFGDPQKEGKEGTDG